MTADSTQTNATVMRLTGTLATRRQLHDYAVIRSDLTGEFFGGLPAGDLDECIAAGRATILVGDAYSITGELVRHRPAEPPPVEAPRAADDSGDEMRWFYEQLSGGGWGPVASAYKPRLKGDRLAGEHSPEVRNVRRIDVWHRHLSLSELQAVYGRSSVTL